MSSVKGVDEIVANLRQMASKVKTVLPDAVDAGGQIVVESIQDRAPVQTGRLRRSIKKKTKLSANGQKATSTIGPDDSAAYAIDVELGNAHAAAQPFMRPGLYRASNRVLQVVTETLNEPLHEYEE